uniref:CFEM domain-containing protein n=1 Tax=Bionectria ochroleuca TaxID=29856 RepID=A0A8H7N9X0_BIOOC
MKFIATPIILALAAGFASAQLGDVPECAKSCLVQYTTGTQIANCAQLDIKCICSNTEFLDGIACCLDKDCDAAGKSAAVTFAKQICSTADVTIPDQVVCKSGSSTTSGSASASSSGSASASASGSASTSGASNTATTTTQSTSTTTNSASQQSGTGAASGLTPFSGSIGAALALLFAL